MTRDTDFLDHGNPDAERLAADFREIMAIERDDGLVFDLEAPAATAIREEMECGGTRLKTAAYFEKTRIPATIDTGLATPWPMRPSNSTIRPCSTSLRQLCVPIRLPR